MWNACRVGVKNYVARQSAMAVQRRFQLTEIQMKGDQGGSWKSISVSVLKGTTPVNKNVGRWAVNIVSWHLESYRPPHP